MCLLEKKPNKGTSRPCNVQSSNWVHIGGSTTLIREAIHHPALAGLTGSEHQCPSSWSPGPSFRQQDAGRNPERGGIFLKREVVLLRDYEGSSCTHAGWPWGPESRVRRESAFMKMEMKRRPKSYSIFLWIKGMFKWARIVISAPL